MNAFIQQAIVQIHRWARDEDARHGAGHSNSRAAARAAHLRKCAQALGQCKDDAGAAREVLCRYAVIGRDESAARLNALAEALTAPMPAANDPVGALDPMLGDEG